MISFPNQKLYIINKKIEEGDIFIMLKWEDFCRAADELSPSALKLYMYLAKNKDGYEFYFSSKDFCQLFNIVDKTYRNAKNELIAKLGNVLNARANQIKEEENEIDDEDDSLSDDLLNDLGVE